MDTQNTPPDQDQSGSQGNIGMSDASFAPTTVIIPQDGQPYTSNEPQTQQSNFVPAIGTPSSASYQKSQSSKNPIVGFLKLLFIIAVLAGIGFFAYQKFLPSTALIGSKETTITYWGLWENDPTLRAVIADFESANPGIKVQYEQQSSKQYRERLQAAINRGEGPDAFRFHNTWVAMIHKELASVPQTVMSREQFADTFYQVASNDLVAGNAIYGIPMMIDGLGLYINEDLFATAGVSPPVTWTDVMNSIGPLTAKNGSTIITSAIALGTANNVEHFSDILATMMLQNGAKLSNLSGPEAEETLVFYRKFADPSDELYTWNDTLDNSISAFANGRVAMILAPSWQAHTIHEINKSLKFHIIPIPQLSGNTINWASYWVEGVSLKSKNQEAAWKFIQYLTSPEGSTKLYTEAATTRLFGEPYARVELGSTLASDPYVGAYIKQAPTAFSFPLASRTGDNGINDKLIKYLEDGINSLSAGNSPAKALETISLGFRQVLSSYGLVSAAPTIAQ